MNTFARPASKNLAPRLLLCLGLLISPAAEARRGPITMDTVREDNKPILLAEITATTPKSIPTGTGRTNDGHALTLRVIEVLRGTLAAKEINIPFSRQGYGAVWEFGTKPTVGMNALVYLASGDGTTWNDYGRPGTIVPLTGLDDARITTARRIIALWDKFAQDLEEALENGCLDADTDYANYCVNDLIDRSPDIEFIWSLFNNEHTKIDVRTACDKFLAKHFDPLGWRTNPARQAVLVAATERHLETGQGDGHLSTLLYAICRYPADPQQVFHLLESIIEREDQAHHSATAMRFGSIYVQLPADRSEQQLNQKILDAIRRILAGNNADAARGAANALHEICTGAANRGIISDQLLAFLAAETQRAKTESLRTKLQEISRGIEEIVGQTRQLLTGEAPHVELTDRWREKTGQQVAITALTSPLRHDKFGFAAELEGRLIWIEGADPWPGGHSNRKGVLLNGHLTQVHDLPVFRPEPGQPFPKGLPVPAPHELEAARARLVLQDTEWELLTP